MSVIANTLPGKLRSSNVAHAGEGALQATENVPIPPAESNRSSIAASSTLNHLAYRYCVSDAEAVSPDGVLRASGFTPKIGHAPPLPPSSIDMRAPLAGAQLIGTDLTSIAKTVKEESVDVKTAAAKAMSDLYVDITRAMQAIETKAKAHGNQGRMVLSRDKAMAELLLVYLTWSAKPIGSVTNNFTEDEWKSRVTDVVFRDVGGTKFAFVDCDKIFKNLWSKLSQAYSKVITVERSAAWYDKIFGGQWDINEYSSDSPMFAGENGIASALKKMGSASYPTTKVESGAFLDTGVIRFDQLPDAIKNLSDGSWALSHDNLPLLIADLKEAASIGMSMFSHQFGTVSLSAAQWTNLKASIESVTSPWRDRQSAMAANARNAASFYDQIFDALAKILRSYNEADKKSVSAH